MDIGNKLKIARKAIGYTLEKASKESCIGQSSISEFENDRREPKFSQLSKLAKVYRRTVEFFLNDKPMVENLMLWRDKPVGDDNAGVEAEFRQLCEQYRNLEIICDEVKSTKLPSLDIELQQFDYSQAEDLAEKFQREHLLGDIPSACIKQILEEKFYIKIFHLAFAGSAISSVSTEFGLAILLNSNNKLWRRNFDLAHELFHLLTWHIFRTNNIQSDKPSEKEEKLANAFASRLLLPTDLVRSKINSIKDTHEHIPVIKLDEIAREFGVSIDALLWRMLSIYNKSPEDIEVFIKKAKSVRLLRPPRQSDTPDKLPERYCSLAIRALKHGKLSLMQFKKYMGIGYKEAEQYLADEKDFTDEEVSISIA